MVASNSKARKRASAATSGRGSGGASPTASGRRSGRASAAASGRGSGGASPAPGSPVRGSRTGRPVMALLDLLGRRWALRILWELRDGSAYSFRDLQERCGGISSSVLNDRLRELRDAGIVMAEPIGGYHLTGRGHELLDALAPLDVWAKAWARRAGGRRPR